MATLLTAAQDAELLALQELYRGTSAPPQGLIPEDVVRRFSKVVVDALNSIGALSGELSDAIQRSSQQPWYYWSLLIEILDLNAVGNVFQIADNRTFWLSVLLPSLLTQPPERPMGLPDGLAVEVAKALKELPGLELAFQESAGLTVLEAIKQAPVPLWIEVIRNISANYTF